MMRFLVLKQKMLNRKPRKSGDKILFFFPFVLGIFGLLIIFDASSAVALADFGDKYHYFYKQLHSFLIASFVFLIFSRLNVNFFKKIALPFFLLNLLMLVLVLIPGLGRQIYGGRRWLQIGPLGFQPAEIAKLSLVIYLSTLFERKNFYLPFLSILAVLLLLLILEPDLGTAVIICVTAVFLYYVSGAEKRNLLLTFVLGTIALPVLIFSSPYRKDRFLSFWNAIKDQTEVSYHTRQVLIALGSGGLLGRGFGQSRQKFLFLPEVATDSIFAIVAEELGLVGGLSLISSFVLLVYRGFKVALTVENLSERLMLAGIIFFIVFQAILNFSSMVMLLPITGVPLPFISYGGSSLLVSMAGMGIVYNISRRNY